MSEAKFCPGGREGVGHEPHEMRVFHMKPEGIFPAPKLIMGRKENFPQRPIISFSSVKLVSRQRKQSLCTFLCYYDQNLQCSGTFGLSDWCAIASSLERTERNLCFCAYQRLWRKRCEVRILLSSIGANLWGHVRKTCARLQCARCKGVWK